MVDAVKQALSLWALQLVPSIFPFMILSTFFLKFINDFFTFSATPKHTFLNKITGLSTYGCIISLLGQCCGYPLGAKLTAAAFQNSKIDQTEADYLMTVCNQTSPAFLTYYAGSYALSNQRFGYWLVPLFFTGTMLTSFITRFLYPVRSINHKSTYRTPQTLTEKKTKDIFILLDQSITESSLAMLRICGYMILFSILSNIILHINLIPFQYKILTVSSLELSNGLFLLKQHLSEKSYYLFLIIGFTSFGGFCTMAQIKGMLIGTSLSIKPYIIGKIIHLIILLSLTGILVQIKVI